MKKLLVIDGNSIVNRAFYGIRLLTNNEGIYTNAVYGMVNIVSKQIERLSPDYCAVAFDVKAPTFRHEFYDSYKAGRHETPPELLSQFPYAKESMKALGAAVLEMAGYEADDILGTLSAMAEKEGYEAYILTGDRDALQLISDTTTVLLATNNDTVPFDRAAFEEKYGVAPEQFVDVKALMGDSSDNIPGVPGIGEKTAVKLISEFGSLDALYQNVPAATLTAGVNKKLEAGKESAFMSQRLARIFREVPVVDNLDAVAYGGIDRVAAYRLFEKLGFSAFIKRFELEATEAECSAAEEKETETKELVTVNYDGLCERLSAASHSAMALEADGYVFFDGETRILAELSESELDTLLCDPEIAEKLICYDAKALYKSLLKKGRVYAPLYHDVMLGAYVLDPSESSFDFSRICYKYLGKNAEDPDAVLLYRLYESIEAKIAENRQGELLYGIEMPLAAVLAEMEVLGCRVDIEGLVAYGRQLEELEDQYKERIYFHAGCEFNVNSPKQLGEVLFDRMMLPGAKKTKTGYSTNAEVLERLKPYHPIIQDILDYRQVAKLRGTYTDALAEVAPNPL